jgi:hypothetical protein
LALAFAMGPAMRPLIPALVAALAALPAAAQDRPVLYPTRDVSVVYRLIGPQAEGQEMRMSWLNAEQKLRTDMPGGISWGVVDRRSQRAFMVMEPQRLVMEMPLDGAGGPPLPELGQNARFTRGGSATVAGLSCTVWRYQEGQDSGEACITQDGVMLRSSGTYDGHRAGMEAKQVTYGAQNAARFRPPEGYRVVQMPGAMPGARPPGR